MDLVILAGSVGNGAAWTNGSIKPLLPLPARGTLLEALVRSFENSPAQKCIICSGFKQTILRRLKPLENFRQRIDFYEDNVPLGTAGCLKACEALTSSSTIMLAGGSVWLDDRAGEDPQWMLEQHRVRANALTVFCTRDPGWTNAGSQQQLRPAGLFCCDRAVFRYIRPGGFQDLKEQLVPALIQAKLPVGVVCLQGRTCEVSDPATYLDIIARILAEATAIPGYNRLAPDIWCGRGVHIAPRARIVGPAMLGHDCRIDDGAVIVGPAMLGNGSQVGRNARVIRVVAERRLRIRPGLHLTDRILTAPEMPRPARSSPKRPSDGPVPPSPGGKIQQFRERFASPTTAVGAILFSLFLWAFWPSISNLWYFLSSNADYGAGQLIPIAALYMVASRNLRAIPTFAFWWPGLYLFGAGVIANIFGYVFRFVTIENMGLVTCAIGIITSVFGRTICSRIWFPLLFLFLMIPLPSRVHYAITMPLQTSGARMAATALETMGIPAARTGVVVQVGSHEIAVAEACSGLRMVVSFLIVTSVIVYVIQRPRWQKIVVLLSSVPIALACNVFRLVLSAFLIALGQGSLAQGVFHDGAGVVMMPVAVALVFLEFWVLSNLRLPNGGVGAVVDAVDDRMGRSTRSLSGG